MNRQQTERHVLGAIMNGDMLVDCLVLNDFLSDYHRDIFEAILRAIFDPTEPLTSDNVRKKANPFRVISHLGIDGVGDDLMRMCEAAPRDRVIAEELAEVVRGGGADMRGTNDCG